MLEVLPDSEITDTGLVEVTDISAPFVFFCPSRNMVQNNLSRHIIYLVRICSIQMVSFLIGHMTRLFCKVSAAASIRLAATNIDRMLQTWNLTVERFLNRRPVISLLFKPSTTMLYEKDIIFQQT